MRKLLENACSNNLSIHHNNNKLLTATTDKLCCELYHGKIS
ncbi:MAG: hypothetical protein ACI8UC_001231 [Psychromonas sp.]|jgi:hypothetical protein